MSAFALMSPAAPLSVRVRDAFEAPVVVMGVVCVSVGVDAVCSMLTSAWRLQRSGSARPSSVSTRILVGRLVGVRTAFERWSGVACPALGGPDASLAADSGGTGDVARDLTKPLSRALVSEGLVNDA